MKKVLLAVVVTAVFMCVSNAQSMKFGVKGGANFANLVGDDVEDADMRISFHIGGVAEFMLSDKFSFQPELLYSSQGAKSEYNDGVFDVKGKVTLDYLNLPLMGKFYVAEGFSVQAGPQIGFLLAANSEVEYDDISTEDDVKEFIKNIDFGVNLGLGYKLPSGLFFDARYNLGLSNIDEEGDAKIRNAVIQVSLGFSF